MGDIMLDLWSCCFEDASCPLAQLGYSRDGKKGKSQTLARAILKCSGST